MRRTRIFFLVLIILLVISPVVCAATKEFVSDPVIIDQVYESMAGPSVVHNFTIDDIDSPELVWIKKIKVEFFNADSQERVSPEYLCHANLRLRGYAKIDDRNAKFNHTVHVNKKLFDLVQGITEIELPENFGIPVLSNEPLKFNTMIFNPTMDEKPFRIFTKTTIEYEKDAQGRFKPLFRRGIQLEVPIETEELHKGSHHQKLKKRLLDREQRGKHLSYHWLVPPGRHTYRHQLAKGMDMPFDTTVHFITVHLHPFAESLELMDVTANQTVYKSNVKHIDSRQGIEQVDSYSNTEGMLLYRDHDYELIAVYNNTTGRKIDAMAVMYLYFWDKNFDKGLVKVIKNK